MSLNAMLWLVPFIDSFMNHAQSMDDLTVVSQSLVVLGLLVFAVLMYPLFAWIWFRIKTWVNGK